MRGNPGLLYTYEQIRRVHVELTTYCNASCPQCPRNIDGGAVNPNLQLTELSLEDFKKVFPPAFLWRLEVINFCGNYGDPSMARDLIPVCEYIRAEAPGVRLTMHSNGSARTPEWWAKLAGLLDKCVFSVDGLEDTNAIYRRNTTWTSIMANATAYLGAGGTAGWDFLVFEHNQHQVKDAEKLAKAMGFENFNAKTSGRFLRDNVLVEGISVRDHKGELVQMLKPPTKRRLQNPTGKVIAGKFPTAESFTDYLTTTPVTCNAQKYAEIFVSAEGLVLPCCWMAQLTPVHEMSERKQQIHALMAALPEGSDSINALKTPLRDVLATRLFQQDVPAGWEPGEKRLKVCAKFCGKHGVSSEQEIQLKWSPRQLLAALR